MRCGKGMQPLRVLICHKHYYQHADCCGAQHPAPPWRVGARVYQATEWGVLGLGSRTQVGGVECGGVVIHETKSNKGDHTLLFPISGS